MPTKRTRAPARKGPEPYESPVCKAPECGRPAYARGHCQTHHRQLLTTGQLKPIRPYRKRSAGTVKFSGLRLTPDCAGKIQNKATREGLSQGAAIAAILADWARRQARAKRKAQRNLPGR